METLSLSGHPSREGEPDKEIHPVDEFPGERPHMEVRAGVSCGAGQRSRKQPEIGKVT